MPKTTAAMYVGPYGHGHHRAYVSGVGELYYGQVVELTEEQQAALPESEWKLVGGLCQQVDQSGRLCQKKKVEGETYCSFHLREFRERAQSIGDNEDGISSST